MQVIGLTGGIGSGKSTFCNLMQQHGIAFIDSDQIARQVVEPGSPGLKSVVETFSNEILNADGTLNRPRLREIIFAEPKDPQPREKLEAILHPLIREETLRQIDSYRQNPEYTQPYLLVAIPLLVEGILKTGRKPDYIDQIWVLDCSQKTQIQRACSRDQSSLSQIKNILGNQASRQQRLQHADKVIDNEKGLEELERQVELLLRP
ncbi:dephospho-CoA kinase [Thiomicrorhabdus xiamenensis]|uniref:Dephospho-CoA kinase n=1 Tax=Thiomicrorhabdus xiamenensis TaxID=2739063 RepID=A0A7D4SY44_9GAMM|nr:dephospho-CoA kinase [Thiomicrorhabdus xiamenensis]QKI88744.1 dephospho-CoA kinase [Thiomicrorhabdus xiamenensis]